MPDDERFLAGILNLTADERSKLEDAGLRINTALRSAALLGGWSGEVDYTVVKERSWLSILAPDEETARARVEAALGRENASEDDVLILTARSSG